MNSMDLSEGSAALNSTQDPKRGFAGAGERPPRIEQIINGVKATFSLMWFRV